MKNYQGKELVTLEIKVKIVNFFCSTEASYFIDGEEIVGGKGNMFPKDWRYGGSRKSVVFKKVVEIIFKHVRKNRPVKLFLPSRYVNFLKKYAYHRGHGERVLAKLLNDPGQKRIDYPIGFIPEYFPKFVRNMKDACEKTMGYFETSHWRQVKQISSFGQIHTVRYYEKTVENDSDTWWISQYRSSEITYCLWISYGDIQKSFSSEHFPYEEVLDIKYHSLSQRFYIKIEHKDKVVWRALV